MTRTLRLLFCLAALAWAGPAPAEEAIVAVAANFLSTAQTLAERFRAETGHEVALAHGSTGRLYAQIVSGAPYDVLLAADAERPRRLEEDGRTLGRKTYAVGRLVLAMRETPPDPERLRGALAGRRVATADPAVAPYGAAAAEVMAATGIAEGAALILYADSVGQVAGMLATGNADAAFLAAAQIGPLPGGPWQVLPLDGHAPILQDAALLNRAGDNPAARAFWEFLDSAEAKAIIADAGYEVPR